MTEVDKHHKPVGEHLVIKSSNFKNMDIYQFHRDSGRCQRKAGNLAQSFNIELNKLDPKQSRIKRIYFLPVKFYNVKSKKKDFWFLCEKRLDTKCFTKWNSNNGGVPWINKEKIKSKGGVGESKIEFHKYSKEELINKILTEDIPQAFSHFTHLWTKRIFLVCDLQGVVQGN